MKLSRQLSLAAAFMFCSLQVQLAQARGPSTPEERAKVFELTRSLERDPLNEKATANRLWLREWIADVPDIRFNVCNDLLGHALADNYPYSRGSIQGIYTSRRRWGCRSSKCSHGDAASILELSTGCGVATDSPGNVLDCAWNACRVPINYRQCRNARIAAASFPRPFVVMAFGGGPSIG